MYLSTALKVLLSNTLCRYGSSSSMAVDGIAWLVGGVSLTQLGCCEVLMLDLTNKTWQGYTLPSPVSVKYLFSHDNNKKKCRPSMYMSQEIIFTITHKTMQKPVNWKESLHTN